MSGVAPRSDRAGYAPRGATRVQSLLQHHRLIVLAGLVLVCGVSWYWVLAMSVDMYGSMRGASAWAMRPSWGLPHLLLLFAMWTVMMVAMMLPSAVPMLMLFIGVTQRSDAAALTRRTYAMAAGYLLVWSTFSAAATVGQRLLTDRSLVTPMMSLADLRLGAAVLIVVGLYQFTPLKRDCLNACRSPLALFTTYWQPGSAGAFRMGLRHGIYCLGCCWALMLLLFVGGVMNAFVIGGLTLFVLIEKATPLGRTASKIGGATLILLGLGLLLR